MELYIDTVNGWQDGSIYDIPVSGIKETIDQLRSEGYNVVIYSTRGATLRGRVAIKDWLKEHDIVVDDIAKDKPIATMYVDDRAIPFNGNCETLMKNIHKFKPWTEMRYKVCAICHKPFTINSTSHISQKYCSFECRSIANKEYQRRYRKNA